MHVWAVAQMPSRLVPVCTDLSNLFDSVLLPRQDMQSPSPHQRERGGQASKSSVQFDSWGPESCDCPGSRIIKKENNLNVVRHIFKNNSSVPLMFLEISFLPSLIFKCCLLAQRWWLQQASATWVVSNSSKLEHAELTWTSCRQGGSMWKQH